MNKIFNVKQTARGKVAVGVSAMMMALFPMTMANEAAAGVGGAAGRLGRPPRPGRGRAQGA